MKLFNAPNSFDKVITSHTTSNFDSTQNTTPALQATVSAQTIIKQPSSSGFFGINYAPINDEQKKAQNKIASFIRLGG